MTRKSLMSFGLPALAVMSVMGSAVQAQSTTDTAKYSSFVQNKTNGAGSGYVATSAGTGTAAGTFFTNNGNLDLEGPGTTSTASQYADYGLLDFSTPEAFRAPVASVNSLSLKITEYAANFTSAATNSVDIYLVTDAATSDFYSATASANSPLTYEYNTPTTGLGTTNPLGLGQQLGATYLLGTVSYSNGKPQVDTLNLSLPSGAATSLFLSELNSGGNIRLAMDEDSSVLSGASAYDGVYYAAPALTFNAFDANGVADIGTPAAAPEPSSVAVMVIGVGMMSLIAARRRYATK